MDFEFELDVDIEYTQEEMAARVVDLVRLLNQVITETREAGLTVTVDDLFGDVQVRVSKTLATNFTDDLPF